MTNPSYPLAETPHPTDKLHQYLDALETAIHGIHLGLQDGSVNQQGSYHLLMFLCHELRSNVRQISVLIPN
ncbi:hypothetical protein QCD60_10795 [Pokkaliibacter sp. MBI-7]|uniref:hypothetical protein n=1 Tax=Pokkaliibacter sp. MBI-7 TaxID=3040600 RepID=UPI0024483BFD|nr:hypothetical protein [Pokkaliibacter sp. MBI-7]MDH2433056.1 hypothetical protein [Pokkaliibacter sp. MBI-7]